MRMLRCPRCYKESAVSANFCGRCGYSLQLLHPSPVPPRRMGRPLIWVGLFGCFFFFRAVSKDAAPPPPPTPAPGPVYLSDPPERAEDKPSRKQRSKDYYYRR